MSEILKTAERKAGKIFDHSKPSYFSRFLLGTIETAEIESIDKGLRHSFCTYRLTAIQSAPQVALKMGNSPKIIFTNYRELATPKDARIWFAPQTETENSKLVHLAAA